MPQKKKEEEEKKEPENETAGDPFADGETQQKDVRYKDLLVKIRYNDVTRNMRDKSLEQGAITFKQENPAMTEGVVSPVAFEEALIRKVIKSWEWFRVSQENGEEKLTPIKTPPPALGWSKIKDENLGNKIAEAVGVAEVMLATFKTEKAKEVVEAKN